MQRHPVRVGAFVALAVAGLSIDTASAAATPAGGTLTEAAPVLHYSGGPLFTSPNATATNSCSDDLTSEAYNLTVELPADFDTRRPNDSIQVSLSPVTSGDMVLSILDSNGDSLDDADAGGPGGGEFVTAAAVAGKNEYKVLVCVFAGSAAAYNVTISLSTSTGSGAGAYAPRFQYLLSPAAMGNGAGEPSIAYNPASKKTMFQAGLETLRATLPENRTDDPLNPTGLPEACDAFWEDVSFPTTSTASLDPIGVGDPTTGRYYSGQLSAKSQNMAFTDDDGETWNPSVGNFPGAAGVDHQTMGWGPYVVDGPAAPLTDYPNAVYYCSQDIAYANCSRSDDGGASFLPPIVTYNTTQCGGLHGHIRAAPDGTVYLPNKNCNDTSQQPPVSTQAVAVSEDNGFTWEVRPIPTSTPGNTDPQMALASDGTGYFCYTAADGRPRVAVTRDRGKTFTDDTNLGAAVGVVTAVFAQGIAGDPDRAACGFIGTTTEGNSGAEDFEGVWYPYIAVTYDGGKTWSTTNVSPEDPAQGAGGICTNGTTCGANRNLLDFNEMTLDEKGRAMLGFADGCVGACVTDPTSISRSEKAAIARIVGGRSLLASLDRAEPHVPQAACLAGTRPVADTAALTWRAPADDGKSAITGYKIYRGTTAAAQSLILSVSPKTAYTDYTIDPNEPEYFYRIVAVNALGDSVQSNLIKLAVDVNALIETPCVPPGLTMTEDAEGDALDNVPSHDVRKLSVSQPFFANGDYKIYFHLKVSDLAVVPANTTWPISFCSPAFPCIDPGLAVAVPGQSNYTADNKYFTVEMTTVAPGTPVAPLFQVRKPTADGATSGSRTVIAALPESSYSSDGLITIGVNASDLGLANTGAGTDVLQKFQVRVSVNGVAISATPDNMPDGLSGAGVYTTTGLSFCDTNTPPQADLKVNIQQGLAPLTVAFDASDSFDADEQDNIAQYIFDFGDNTENVVQSTPFVEHTYTEDGSYNAKVRVKDSRGLAGTAAASKVIQVGALPVGGIVSTTTATPGNNVVFGGAWAPLALMALSLVTLGRRRVGRGRR
jgi:hypothetical protein